MTDTDITNQPIVDEYGSSWYILEVNPEPWAIGPVGYARRSGKMSAYVGRNAQLDTYKKTIQEAVQEFAVPLTGVLDITFFFWRNRAEYKTPQSRSHRKHEADATNLQKSTEDALQDLLYKNDKDNHHVESYIIEQGPDVTGKVVIKIKAYLDFDPDLIPDEVWSLIEKIDHPSYLVTIDPKRSTPLYGDGKDIF